MATSVKMVYKPRHVTFQKILLILLTVNLCLLFVTCVVGFVRQIKSGNSISSTTTLFDMEDEQEEDVDAPDSRRVRDFMSNTTNDQVFSLILIHVICMDVSLFGVLVVMRESILGCTVYLVLMIVQLVLSCLGLLDFYTSRNTFDFVIFWMQLILYVLIFGVAALYCYALWEWRKSPEYQKLKAQESGKVDESNTKVIFN